MQHHPHVHCIVPAIGYDPATNQLIHPKKPGQFLIPFRPLANRFRSLIHTALKTGHPDLYRNLTPNQRRALSPATTWNAQLQPAGKGRTAIRYLARYTQRSALGPKRLIRQTPDGKILLHHQPTRLRHGSGVQAGRPHPTTLKLTIPELIRRWLLHVLPKGFARVRHYGFLASAAIKTRQRVRALLGQGPEHLIELPELPPHCCPHCGEPLRLLRKIPRPRGPP